MRLLLSFILMTLAAGAAPRPNIIVILADDLGYSDLGCYGGEIQTPNLDGLAGDGLRFSNFYNTSRCCPTRASLLTGVYPTQAGVGRMTFDQELPGYRGVLARDRQTIAEALRKAGYRTAMVGKWHVSPTKSTPENALWVSHRLDLGPFSDLSTYPTERGFEEYWGNVWGVVDYFDPFSLVHDKTPEPAPPAGFYYTDAINERAAQFVRKYGRGEAPFFLYVAHTAPHWPLHALPKDIQKYADTYAEGWDAIREGRYRRLVGKGLIREDRAVLSERLDKEQRWQDNPDKAFDARAMAVHAAMVDRLDQGLVKIFEALRETGDWDNTLILFLSDNGASPEEPQHMLPGFDRPSHTRDGRPVRYATRKQGMPGAETTYAGIGPMWANAANTPFRYWKKEQYEGGVATPLIAHWPAGMRAAKGSVTGRPGHVIDIMATALDLAGAEAEQAIEGKSLAPVFEGVERGGHDAIYFEHFGARGLRKGDWKLVALQDHGWELYNLGEDRTETRDLAKQRPELVKELAALWERWAERAQVYPAPGR
jgi:arylsulfatase